MGHCDVLLNTWVFNVSRLAVFYWSLCHYFCLFLLHQCVVVPGPLSCSSKILFSSEINNLFYFALVKKNMGRNIPCHIKYHFKIHNSDLATLLFIVVIYQPQSSLSPSSFCCEILITLHFQNPSSHCVVSAVSGGFLTILPVLYFKVFPSFFLLISSFFPQVSEKRTKPLYF